MRQAPKSARPLKTPTFFVKTPTSAARRASDKQTRPLLCGCGQATSKPGELLGRLGQATSKSGELLGRLGQATSKSGHLARLGLLGFGGGFGWRGGAGVVQLLLGFAGGIPSGFFGPIC
jgi:hypothetical protein